MYLLNSIMCPILLLCYNWFLFSNKIFIIYEICKLETKYTFRTMWVIVKMLLYCLQTIWKTSYYSLLDMVGCTIQHSRDPNSQNIFISILWAVVGISLSPVRHILPIIPYLVNFSSSPRLGLISLNHSFGRSINSSSGSLWKNWDHGWVEKQHPTVSPCGMGIFFNKPFVVGILLRLLGPIFPHLANFPIFTNLSYFSKTMS